MFFKSLLQPHISGTPYFYWIDILRGFAALSILFWHYPNLYLDDRSAMPFYTIFAPLYNYGELAVLLFWVISGFVFAHVYLQTKGTGKEFFVNRFARLYPLHFATLIIVAGLQLLSWYQTGGFQIYPHNDLYHFILNIFFIPHWGFQEGRSFNAPVWSVSVELLIYLIFWVVLPFIAKRGLLLTVFLVPVFLIMFLGGVPGSAFWKCGMFFFAGSTLFIFLNALKRERVLLIITSALLLTLSLVFGELAIYRNDVYVHLFGFAGLVLLFAIFDLIDTKKLGKKIKRIGDISYGTYLIHIPVQISLILILDRFGVGGEIALTNGFFFLFFFMVIFLANISFVYFENPMRRFIRNKWCTNKK